MPALNGILRVAPPLLTESECEMHIYHFAVVMLAFALLMLANKRRDDDTADFCLANMFGGSELGGGG